MNKYTTPLRARAILKRNQKLKTPKETRSFGSGLFKFLAATGITVGIVLHFIGNFSHEYYLIEWGVPTGQFPKQADWLGTNGYLTLFVQIFLLFKFIQSDPVHFFAFWFSVTVFTGYIYFIFTYKSRTSNYEYKIAKLILKLSPFLRFIAKVLIIGSSATFLLFLSMFTFSAILSLPMRLGEAHGKYLAQSEIEKFYNGCSEKTGYKRCIEIRKDGMQVVKGFVIDSSEQRIAVYVPETKIVRVIHLEGMEIISTAPKPDNLNLLPK